MAPLTAAGAAPEPISVRLTGLSGEDETLLSGAKLKIDATTGEPAPAVPMPDPDLDAPPGLRPPLMKFVAANGEVVASDQGVHYVPTIDGEQTVNLVYPRAQEQKDRKNLLARSSE
jgi:hypothetical protein